MNEALEVGDLIAASSRLLDSSYQAQVTPR
jgi:hypothetical protein